MRKILIVLAVVLFVGEVRTANLKDKFSAGVEISNSYDYSYYYYQGLGLQDMELMYGWTNNLALIVGGKIPIGIDLDLRLKFGLQGYVEPTKAVSPYLKVSFNYRHYNGYTPEESYYLKIGVGMEYFWTEHLGLAIHMSFVTFYLGEKADATRINAVPGIYFWIRK